ncbi:hypothetical protein HK405_012367 [Cladochytrium tenue]|nr:hypothetical protein HK405_012367 [Cladochytrium tenue]
MRDGSLYLFTRFDPLFLLLPVLQRARDAACDHADDKAATSAAKRRPGRAVLLDDALYDPDVPALAALAGLHGLRDQLERICDIVADSASGLFFLRLSDEKVAAWLAAKADRLLAGFDRHPALLRAAAAVNPAVAGMPASNPDAARARAAVVADLLADSLPPSWVLALRSRLGLTDLTAAAAATTADCNLPSPPESNAPASTAAAATPTYLDDSALRAAAAAAGSRAAAAVGAAGAKKKPTSARGVAKKPAARPPRGTSTIKAFFAAK